MDKTSGNGSSAPKQEDLHEVQKNSDGAGIGDEKDEDMTER